MVFFKVQVQSDPSLHHLIQSDHSLHHLIQSDPSLHPLVQSDPSLHPLVQSDPSLHHLVQSDTAIHHLLPSDVNMWSRFLGVPRHHPNFSILRLRVEADLLHERKHLHISFHPPLHPSLFLWAQSSTTTTSLRLLLWGPILLRMGPFGPIRGSFWAV